MFSDPTIRSARRAELETLVAFNAQLGAETEQAVLDGRRLREGVRAIFDDPRRGRYLLAEIDGRVVGQTMITFEWSDWRNGDFWGSRASTWCRTFADGAYSGPCLTI